MTTLQLIDQSIPHLQLTDTAADARTLMLTHKITHLPITAGEKYLGMIADVDLKQDMEAPLLQSFSDSLHMVAINASQHFLKAVPICNLYHTNIVCIVNDAGELLGSLKAPDLLNVLGNLCGANEFGALIVLDVEASKLSISKINSIVESDGANILHINISPLPPSPLMRVTLQINKKEVATIVATFERYEYSVAYYAGEELFENEINTNYQNLMNYLQI